MIQKSSSLASTLDGQTDPMDAQSLTDELLSAELIQGPSREDNSLITLPPQSPDVAALHGTPPFNLAPCMTRGLSVNIWKRLHST